jgi:elongation factor Ts
VTAAKRAGKAAKEGKITIISDPSTAIIYEVNSETDFVARNEDFSAFISNLGKILIESKPSDLETAKKISSPIIGNQTVESRLTELIGKIGENISFRRYKKVDADPKSERLFIYIHGDGRIGIIVKLTATAGLESDAMAVLGKELAMQVAAANPIAADKESISADVIAKEKEIYFTQAQSSGKPEKIWEKIVEGKLVKFFQEVVLTEQAFIKDPEITVTDRIAAVEKETSSKIKVLSFVRFELGAEE